MKRAERVAESEGKPFLIRDIEDDLANYCQVSRETIQMIKRMVNQPSLALGIKMAEYFGVPVEELFKLVPKCPVCSGKDEVGHDGVKSKCLSCNGKGYVA